MTCTELAKQLQVNPSTISQWRTGATEPALWMVPLIAEALRVPVEWLAFGIGPREEALGRDAAVQRLRKQDG